MTAHTTRLLPEELERIEYLCKHKGVHPIAVDLAARVFQICYVDLSSGKLCNYQLSRPKFIEFYKSRPDRTLFGFEACGACNYQRVDAFFYLPVDDPAKCFKVNAVFIEWGDERGGSSSENRFVIHCSIPSVASGGGPAVLPFCDAQ